jgi:hypothetical protein
LAPFRICKKSSGMVLCYRETQNTKRLSRCGYVRSSGQGVEAIRISRLGVPTSSSKTCSVRLRTGILHLRAELGERSDVIAVGARHSPAPCGG